jgi:hypothetical protein
MAEVNIAEPGYLSPGVKALVASRRNTVKSRKLVPLSKPRSDNAGPPDFGALAEKRSTQTSVDTLPIGELHGFVAYQKAGGTFSERLYETIMAEVIDLQKPGEREKSKFSTGTEEQIKGFEDRHNKPFPATLLPPKENFSLTEVQKDAYRLLRENRLVIPEEDKGNGINPYQLPDIPLFEQILKMPSLESYLLSKQKQPQALPAAA